MPQPTFRDSAILSRLVSEEDIRQAERLLSQRASGSATAVADDELAATLVELGRLTSYQAAQLQVGRTKLNLGPYIVKDFIGQGGMGQVYKAEHEVMGRETAVKVLPRHKSTPEAINAFQREIRMQAQLDHPNLVRAFDAGHDGNVHYLVTEYVPGTDLRRLVRSQGPLTMQQASSIIRQAALGLQHAHQSGLIHRDVKPGNILVTPEGVAKVSDVGLAGVVGQDDQDPRSGKVVGTADYLSPEQIRNPREITSVSDIYSLGCTLYYAVTGKVPFPGGTARDKTRRHCSEAPMHPRRFNQGINEEFVEIIAEMMEKAPERRLQTAAEVAARLEPWSESDTALLTDHMRASPWLPPPVPTEADEQQDTDTTNDELDSQRQESQISQPTFPAALDDTRKIGRRRLPPAPFTVGDSIAEPPQRLSRGVSVSIALAVSIPVSMLLGAVLSFILLTLFQ